LEPAAINPKQSKLRVAPEWGDVCFTCGTCAGGGAWAMPYSDERIYYGRLKAKQIRDTGAKMVVAPCHNCRDQLLKSLDKE
jgi:Fe-S oxidoreductase